MLAGDVEVARGTAVVRPLGSARRVRITWDAASEHRIEVRVLEDPMLSEVWSERLTRLEVDVTDRRSLRMAIELDTPIGDPR